MQCTYYIEWGIWTIVTMVMLLAWMRPSGFSVRRVVVPWVFYLTATRFVIAVGTSLVAADHRSGFCFEALGSLVYTLCWAPLLYRTLRSDATFDMFVNAAAYQSGALAGNADDNDDVGRGRSRRSTQVVDDTPLDPEHEGSAEASAAADALGQALAADDDAAAAAATAGDEAPVDSGVMRRFQPLLTTHSLRLIELDSLSVGKMLGSGGFGEVYQGELDSKKVAIKKLMASSRGDALHEFVKEVDVLGKLKHRNIIELIGVVIGRDAQYLVLEFAALGSVFDYVHKRDSNGRRRQLSWPLAWRIALDAARGMAYLHSFDPPILHRDLKSQNLLLTAKYRTKLCDFGLSRVKSLTKTMSRIGTVQWVAPEVLREER